MKEKKKNQSRIQDFIEIMKLCGLVLLPALFTHIHLTSQSIVLNGQFHQFFLTLFDLPAYFIIVVGIAIAVARYFTVRIRDSRLYGVWFVYLVLVTCFCILIWSMSGYRFRVDDELTVGTTTYFVINIFTDNTRFDLYECENQHCTVYPLLDKSAGRYKQASLQYDSINQTIVAETWINGVDYTCPFHPETKDVQCYPAD